MRNPEKIMEAIDKDLEQQSRLVDDYKKARNDEVAADANYDMVLAIATLKVRQAGHPHALISRLSAGEDNVWKAKLDHGNKKTIAEAVRMELENTRTRIDARRSILTWMREERKG